MLEQKEFDIKFKPLSEGLGLDHFKDGLPYTPASIRKKNQNFQIPMPRAPRFAELEVKRIEAKPEEIKHEEVTYVYAKTTLRVMAYFLDTVLSVSLFASIVWSSFKINGFDARDILLERRGSQFVLPLLLLYMVVHVGYFLVQESTWRTTIGKAVFGIRIMNSSGILLLVRAFCFFASVVPFGAGLIWSVFDAKKRCWHDAITDSDVVST